MAANYQKELDQILEIIERSQHGTELVPRLKEVLEAREKRDKTLRLTASLRQVTPDGDSPELEFLLRESRVVEAEYERLDYRVIDSITVQFGLRLEVSRRYNGDNEGTGECSIDFHRFDESKDDFVGWLDLDLGLDYYEGINLPLKEYSGSDSDPRNDKDWECDYDEEEESYQVLKQVFEQLKLKATTMKQLARFLNRIFFWKYVDWRYK
jgi:hypothetical protein